LRPDTRGCVLDRAVRSNELCRFSTTALQWEQLDVSRVSGSPPIARDGHAMAAVGSDLIIFGGIGGCLLNNCAGCMLDCSGWSNELFRFSTTALQWEQLDASRVSGPFGCEPWPSARYGHTMAAVGSDLIIFGGSIGSGEEARCCACWPLCPTSILTHIESRPNLKLASENCES